jgi:hypothetical protein
MHRSAAVSLLAVPALALGSGAYAAPSPTSAVWATVASSGPQGQDLTLTQDRSPAGAIHLKPFVNTSATAFVCAGSGTVLGLGPGKVRIRWHCPVGRACEGHAEGTLKSNGSTLALLHVKATVAKVQSKGSTFKIGVELIGE